MRRDDVIISRGNNVDRTELQRQLVTNSLRFTKGKMLPVTIAVTEEPQNEYQPISLALAAQIEYSNRGIGTCDHDTLSALGVQDGDWVVLLVRLLKPLNAIRHTMSVYVASLVFGARRDQRSLIFAFCGT